MSNSRHAYLVFAHEHPNQLATLLRLLDHPENDVYLHLDPSASGFQRETLEAQVRRGTLAIYSIQHYAWGGEALIDGILALLGEAVKRDYQYIHLLSGSDLPLRPQAQIHAFFEANAGLEYIDFDEPFLSNAVLSDRLRTYHFFQNSREAYPAIKNLDCFLLAAQHKLGINRLKHADFSFQKGSLWFSITKEFALYCLAHAQTYRPYFRFSKCGDELFFQTLLLNSPFLPKKATNTCNDPAASMRYIDWERGNGASPYVFRAKDYETILQSGMLFARKFNETIDSEIIQEIAEQVSHS